MSQPANRALLSDLPDDEPWPPIPPDVDTATIQVETPEFLVTPNSMFYKIQGRPSTIYKFNIPVRGRVLGKPKIGNGELFFYGFMMDLASPIPPTLPPSQRRDIMYQMVHTVQRLHTKGIVHGDVKLENMLLDSHGRLRLCDFAEGRYVDDNEHIWDGASTWHFESPNRLLRAQRFGRDPPPPIIEDDLYGLGLSIWQLFTGRIPHEDILGDDLDLKERQKNGETVNVAEVSDQEARDIITGLLREGGARF